MKLFLTSNGFMNTPLEKDFLEMTGNSTGLKVAIIPTASDPIEWVPEKEGDQMKGNFLDLVNIFLMLISAIAAFFIPFQLFLFSYAVLGPLHYLTEISWLNQRQYFTKFKFDYIPLVLIGLFISLVNIFKGTYFISFYGSIMFFAFFASLIMVTIENKKVRICAFLSLAILSLTIKNSQLFFSIFAIFLPTIIHVFFFTGCFVLYGTLRNKSKTGLLSVMVFITCFIFLFFLTVNIHTFTLNSYIQNAYHSFESVNLSIMNLLNINNPNVQYAIYVSSAGLSIIRFIAFAYTYHYLNWFSKTKIIRWHLMPKWESVLIIALWILSVCLYIYSYSFGLLVLFFLSLLHVLLEFPLNHKTFIGIYHEVKNRFLHLPIDRVL